MAGSERVNIQARIYRFCMDVDLDITHEMMMMMMITAVTQSIFNLGPPDLAW